MSQSSEIELLIVEINETCPNIVVSQQTSFGEKPFESGIWRFWNKTDESVHISLEVHDGMLWAIYANKEFENKYPISAKKICDFLNSFEKLKTSKND